MLETTNFSVTAGMLQDYLCKKIDANHSLAEELLPSASGFFFGGTEYDEWYYNDIAHTIKCLTEALEDESADEFEYHASW